MRSGDDGVARRHVLDAEGGVPVVRGADVDHPVGRDGTDAVGSRGENQYSDAGDDQPEAALKLTHIGGPVAKFGRQSRGADASGPVREAVGGGDGRQADVVLAPGDVVVFDHLDVDFEFVGALTQLDHAVFERHYAGPVELREVRLLERGVAPFSLGRGYLATGLPFSHAATCSASSPSGTACSTRLQWCHVYRRRWLLDNSNRRLGSVWLAPTGSFTRLACPFY